MGSIRARILPEVALLFMMGAILLWKAFSGGLALYIHPRYETLMIVSGIALVVIALGRLILAEQPLRRSLLLLPAIPVLLAVIVPARPLGASLVPGKALAANSNDSLISRWQANSSDDTRDWSLLEWTAAVRKDDFSAIKGKAASFEGFIFRTDDLPADEVFVGRYVVVCCTADGTALSMRVKTPNAAELPIDQWVRVDGTFEPAAINGTDTPMIVGTVTAADTPASPYLYP